MYLKFFVFVVVCFFFGFDDSLFFGVIIVNVSNIGIVVIEDFSNFFKSWVFGFYVEEVNEDEFDSNLNLIF